MSPLLVGSISLISSSDVIQGNCTIFSSSHPWRTYYLAFLAKPFGQPPVGDRRWELPTLFLSGATRNATTLGPACLQQFSFLAPNLTKFLPFPPRESEDCLFL